MFAGSQFIAFQSYSSCLPTTTVNELQFHLLFRKDVDINLSYLGKKTQRPHLRGG
jgi:hypothetical protein